MRRIRGRTLVLFDPEIERTITRIGFAYCSSSPSFPREEFHQEREEEDQGSMGANPRVVLKELGTPGTYRFKGGIAPPTTLANDFEIRPAMITMIELRLKLFPFSLIGKALEWLDKEVKPNSLRTWDEVTKEFLSRLYPQKKTVEARTLIQSFKQKPSESFYEAWERYKECQRECPHHGILTYQIIEIFYAGLCPQGKSCRDAGAGGPIMNKSEEEVVVIIENVVCHYMDWKEGERDSTNKSSSTIYSVDHLNAINNLSSQVSNLGKEMTLIKAKLKCDSSIAPSLPSHIKGRGTPSNSTPLSTSSNMPSGCVFCDRFDGPRNFGNNNANQQGGFDNNNNGGYRNQGNHGVDLKKPVYSITTRSGKVLEERVSRMSEEDEKRSDSSEENENGVSRSMSKEEVQEKKMSDESSKMSDSSNEKSVEKERKQYEDFKPILSNP
ncbi:uncharacterized protein LOC110725160 [Chenopodium quinoa]|uniref:uncharacterized protein LOC110725160 n=1 Tax=Chenopodium quinoa TaxID=63459 RepID=UPI000B789D4B|nr:uncharacterized protein LOC110725160 [Chenopodium quinoa]